MLFSKILSLPQCVHISHLKKIEVWLLAEEEVDAVSIYIPTTHKLDLRLNFNFHKGNMFLLLENYWLITYFTVYDTWGIQRRWWKFFLNYPFVSILMNTYTGFVLKRSFSHLHFLFCCANVQYEFTEAGYFLLGLN